MNKPDWMLMRETEELIKTRLDRGLLLDHLSITEIEQLHYLAKTVDNDQLAKALNGLLEQKP